MESATTTRGGSPRKNWHGVPTSDNGSGPDDKGSRTENSEPSRPLVIPVDAYEVEIDEALENHVFHILELLELDPNSEHFKETPRRVRELLQAFRVGSEGTLGEILKAGFEETQDNILVVQTQIPFKGICAHHLVPFFGTATVGYIPRKRVVGLSKLTRLVQAAGTIAPTTQEHITNLVADTLFHTAEPLAAGCVTKALHGCMAVRGVNAPTTWTTVSALRGQFLLNPLARQEFLDAAGGGTNGSH